ncbi:protein O-mannosyl-transferase TMTC1-like isoform X2 [Culicoides brevitarsis]|uniref:protein O-mannosyl-transferase TMTC1-like isoform X2 n=1 Tax=Culicoides brevitarsis TaxID=469753 RepID=UPI00307BF856
MKRRVTIAFPPIQSNHNPCGLSLCCCYTSSSYNNNNNNNCSFHSCELNNYSNQRHFSSRSSSASSSCSSSSTTSMHRRASNTSLDTDDWRVYLFIAVIAVGCYLNGIHGDFVHDDIPAITMNKDVLGATPLTHVFRNDFWGTPMSDINSHKSYRPLTTLSFRLNHVLFGLHSIWFHATNVLLHAVACVLFTKVCTTIAGLRKNFAIFAGILFAIHPIHTEAVTGIVGRADVLACIFFLVSILVYHGQIDDPDSTSILLSTILGGLSMLAKETGITVLLINLMFDVYKSWPSLKRTIVDVRWSEETYQFARRFSRVLLSMGVLLAIRLALLQGSLPRFSQQDNPAAFHPNIYVRLMTFCYLAAFNWWLLLCPSTLSHDWQMGSIPLVTSISDARNILTFVTFFVLILLSYRALMDFEHHRHVPLVLGIMMLITPFMPATNLLVTVGFVVAERVLYIPSIGCVLLVVYGAQNLWHAMPKSRCIIIITSILLLTAGCLKTLCRNKDWNSRESLLRAGLKVLPHNAKMHYNFGNFLRDSAEHESAIRHYHEALRLWPSYASAHNNLGTLLDSPEMAEQHFLAAIRYSSEHINAHYNLGRLYRKCNKTDESVHLLERCIKLEPRFVPAYLELVKIYRGWSAGRILQRVVQINPKNADLRVQYGDWLYEHHLLHEALYQYQSGLRATSTHQTALTRTCRTLRRLGQNSRLHQLILRWQFVIQRSNGFVPTQSNIYLRDWSLKHELRNRAMIYDNDNLIRETKTSTSSPAASTSSSNGRSTDSADRNADNNINNLQPPVHSNYHHHAKTQTSSTAASSHCNRSDNTSQSCKKDRVITRKAGISASQPSASTSERKTSDVESKSKRYAKTRHTKVLTEEDSIAPLLLPNILEKL